jgi:gluconokinase
MRSAASTPRHLVVMGVSGSGKTTIAKRLAAELGHEFADADDFHPAVNVAKMARGEALTDADREPWLRTLAAWIAQREDLGHSTVLACSALKRRYRDALRSAAPRLVFAHLDAPRKKLLRRLQHREGHYMPATLLASQLATLEPLGPDESGVTLDAAAPPEEIVENLLYYISINL